MRYIRMLSIAIFGIALVVIGMANRETVTLRLVPDELAGAAAVTPELTLPLFVVIFGGILVGLLVGFIWEWMREHKHRADLSKSQRRIKELEREVHKLKGEKHEGKDEVLAILEQAS